jgi:hypothetical protein
MIGAMPCSPASPLSLHRHLPERSSPSRVRFAAQKQRALDRSGPFRKLISDKGKGANAKSQPFSVRRQYRRTQESKTLTPPLDDVNNLQA